MKNNYNYNDSRLFPVLMFQTIYINFQQQFRSAVNSAKTDGCEFPTTGACCV